MKNKLLLLASAMIMAGFVRADILDGSFNGTNWSMTTGGNLASNMLDKGWVVFRLSNSNAFNWASGEVTRYSTNVSAGTARGFGQAFTSTMTGSNVLSITWAQDDIATASSVRFALWGINGSATNLSTLSLGGYTAGASNPNITLLAYYFVSGGDFSGTLSTNFNAGTGYSLYAFGAYSDADAGGTSFSVSDVRITSVVPEPATAGLFMLALVASFMSRRMIKSRTE